MKTFFLLAFIGLSLTLCAATTTGAAPSTSSSDNAKMVASVIAQAEGGIKSIMMIDPKARAADYMQAYDVLRKEKTANKVVFQLSTGETISNIIDMTLMNQGTMIIFRFNTPQGIKLQAVELEDVLSLSLM